MHYIVRTFGRLAFSVGMLLCVAGTFSMAQQDFVTGRAAALGWGLASLLLFIFIYRAPRDWKSLDPWR